MALGGGNFTLQNKVLPGSYINFVSVSRASLSLSERGYVAMPLCMDWGPGEEVFALYADQLQEQSRELFGYDSRHPKLRGIRDLFCHAKALYGYRINGRGIQAACDYGTARYAGTRGNDLRLVISREGKNYVVKTFLESQEMDSQEVPAADALKDNAYVVFNRKAFLKETAGVPFTGGTNSIPALEDYQKFLDQIESRSFHALGLVSDEQEIKELFARFTKRMRDEQGIKFQTVLFRYPGDYEGLVSLENTVAKTAAAGRSQAGKAVVSQDACALIYWVTGAIAGCAVNASNTNLVYNGEYEADTDYTQDQLEKAIKAGTFLLHKVGDEVRVLEDINTLITYEEEKNEDFSQNQTIRVLDQVGNDIAALFNEKYLGKIPNDQAGRVSLWNDVVTYLKSLSEIRAIGTVEADGIVVEAGGNKRSVVVGFSLSPINCMTHLYMTVVVS